MAPSASLSTSRSIYCPWASAHAIPSARDTVPSPVLGTAATTSGTPCPLPLPGQPTPVNTEAVLLSPTGQCPRCLIVQDSLGQVSTPQGTQGPHHPLLPVAPETCTSLQAGPRLPSSQPPHGAGWQRVSGDSRTARREELPAAGGLQAARGARRGQSCGWAQRPPAPPPLPPLPPPEPAAQATHPRGQQWTGSQALPQTVP